MTATLPKNCTFGQPFSEKKAIFLCRQNEVGENPRSSTLSATEANYPDGGCDNLKKNLTATRRQDL